jgi:hypothetical protein
MFLKYEKGQRPTQMISKYQIAGLDGAVPSDFSARKLYLSTQNLTQYLSSRLPHTRPPQISPHPFMEQPAHRNPHSERVPTVQGQREHLLLGTSSESTSSVG